MTGLERTTNNNKIANYLGYVNEYQDAVGRIHWYVQTESYKTSVGREDELKFDISFDALIPVVEHIHNTYYKHGIAGRDLMYTIGGLLGGGYNFFCEEKLSTLELTLENLYQRVIMFIDWYNVKSQNGKLTLTV